MAAPPEITHTVLSCLSPKQNAKVVATVSGQPSSVRVYFHAAGNTCGDYYVDMLPDAVNPSIFTAILPMPSSAENVVYQIRVKNGGGKEVTSNAVSVPVRNNCALPSLTGNDLQRAQTIVLGLTETSQGGAPCKFSCRGVKSVVTVGGDLKPNEECRLLLAGKPFYATPAGAAAAAALLTGAGFAFENSRNSTAPSPARP